MSVHLANVPHTEINLLSGLTRNSHSLNVCVLQCSSGGPTSLDLLSLKLPCQNAALSICVHTLGPYQGSLFSTLEAFKFHPKFKCDSRVWKNANGTGE